MSLPIQKRIVAAAAPPSEADDAPPPARGGLDLLSAAIGLHPLRADAPSGESPERARAPAPTDRDASRSPLGRDMRFPEILMDILSNEDYAPIIGWMSRGERFIIRDPKKLTSDILPRHFHRGANFLSFRRKLNRYGFNAVRHRIANSGPIFEHKYFRQGCPELLGKIYCQKKTASGNAPVAKTGVAGNGAAEGAAQGCGPAGAAAAVSQVTVHQPVAASNGAANAAAAATHTPDGVLAELINNAKSNALSNHVVVPSYYDISTAPELARLVNSMKSGVSDIRSVAPSSYAASAASAAARDPRSALASNNHAVALGHGVDGAVPRGAPLPLTSGNASDRAFRDLLESELLLRELRRRKQRALVRLLRDAHLPAGDDGL